jgi:filamentous hemagglutinin
MALVTSAHAVAKVGVAIAATAATVDAALSSLGTRFLSGGKAISFGKVVGEGTVDLAGVRARIADGEQGSLFENREGALPAQEEGYYSKHVIPTPGVRGPGPQRLVVGKGGEEYYTSDHYKTFTRVDQQQ